MDQAPAILLAFAAFREIVDIVELLRPYSDVVKLGQMDACLQQVRDVRACRARQPPIA